MGKSGRHKKLNRQEKAKTHLKGGVKTLLKAQNVVNPTLRVKKLMIREQLIDAPEGQVSTRRKQTVQEILSALNHHNTNIRKDALAGLQELVTGHKILNQNLDKILERVASLTSDLESSVRKENRKVAELIFQRVEESQIRPFWNLLLTHLKCTLTNLNPTIRYSTLPFLQLLVVYFPNLVLRSKSIILPSLLGLISSSSTTQSGSGTGTIHKHRLNVGMSGSHNELRERLRVFSLIGSCLQLKEQLSTQNNEKQSVQVIENMNEDNISIFSSDSVSNAKYNNEADVQKRQYLGLYYPSGYDTLVVGGASSNFNVEDDSPPVDILCTSHQATSSTSREDENQFWPRFVQSALACLIETWVEAGPSANDTSTLSVASASLATSSSNKKKEKKHALSEYKQHQMDFSLPGNDKSGKNISVVNCVNETANTNQQRGRGSVNLNQIAVESLSCIVEVMGHLTLSKHSTQLDNTDVKPVDYFIDFIQTVRKNHGLDLKKHFFDHLPYVPNQDMQRGVVTTLNLKMFLIAAHLRLLDSTLMKRLETFLDELIDGETLDSEQCNLILKFFSCIDPTRERPLCTQFIVCILSMKNHRSLICKFLRKILRPENRNPEEMSLIQDIEWEVVTSKLINTCGKINKKFLNLLTYIAIRKLTDVKRHLIEKISIFEEQLQSSSPVNIYEDCVRLFWYAGAYTEFKNSFADKLPMSITNFSQFDKYLTSIN